VASLDRLDQSWVAATRPISPRLLCELLTFTGEATSCYLAGLDPSAAETRSPGSGPTRPRTGWTWPASTASAGPTSSRSATRWGSPAGTVPAPAAQVTLDVVDAVAIIG
jgi:hypothetical protein